MTEGRHPRDPLVKKIVALLVPRGDRKMFETAGRLLADVWGEPERVSRLSRSHGPTTMKISLRSWIGVSSLSWAFLHV